METLLVDLYKPCYQPFVVLLDEHKVAYRTSDSPSMFNIATLGLGVGADFISFGHLIEIATNAAIWGAIASIVIAFINSRRGRKVIITMKDNTIIQAEGLSQKELEALLVNARRLNAIESNED